MGSILSSAFLTGGSRTSPVHSCRLGHFKHLIIFLIAFACLFNTPARSATRSGELSIAISHRVIVSPLGKGWRIVDIQKHEYSRSSEAKNLPDVRYIYEIPDVQVKKIRPYRNGAPITDKELQHEFYLDALDRFLSGSRAHAMIFDTPFVDYEVYGYTHEEHYDNAGLFPAIPVPNDGDLTSFEISVEYPTGVSVDIEVGEPSNNIKLRVIEKSARVARYTIDSLSFVEHDVNNPFSSTHGSLLLSVRSDRGEITPTSPNAFTQWYAKNVDLTPPLSAVNMQSMLDSIPNGVDQRATIASIHDWVRSRIRYVADSRGSHRIYPALPDSTLDRRLGDCKDRAYLIQAIAQSRGIPCEMGLVSTKWKPHFSGVSPSFFNHVISVFPLSDTTLYCDPTLRHAVFGQLSSNLTGRQILILDPLDGRYDTLPDFQTEPDFDATLSAHIDSLDQARLILHCRGDNALDLRAMQMHQTRVDKQDILKFLIDGQFGDFEASNAGIVLDSADVVVVEADVTLRNFLVPGKSGWYVSSVLRPWIYSKLNERSRDSLPVHLDGALRDRMTVRIRGVQAVQDSLLLRGGERISYEARIWNSASQEVSISYEHDRRDCWLTGEQKAAFLRFAEDVIRSKKKLFTLRGEK